MVTLRHCPKFASLLLFLFAHSAGADVLFSNFEGLPEGGNLYTAGGDCSISSCFAIRDNFNSSEPWNVTGFTFYLLSPFSAANLENGGRFAVFTAAGAQVVAPTNTTLTITDTGLTYDAGYKIYKLEISGLNVELVPGEYSFGFTNTAVQSIYPGYGSPSVQTISPGFQQLTGSSSEEALLSTDPIQRSEDWAFEVIGTTDTLYEDGFETP